MAYEPKPPVIDDTVDVTGVTLPVVFPIVTLPGAPVFAPATPATANKLYVFPNGQTAVWDGAQYVSYIAPGKSHWSSNTGIANTPAPPDGVNDLTEKLRREGFTGFGIDPIAQVHTTSFGAAIANYSDAAAYESSDKDHTIRFAQGCPVVGVKLHDPNTTPGHILVLLNSSEFKQEVFGDVHNLGGVGRLDTLFPETSHTIQSVEGVWVVIDRDLPIPASAPPVPETPLSAMNSGTIDFTTSGTAGHTLTGVVKKSVAAGNQLAINPDGLFVPAPVAQSNLVATDSSTIDFTTSGTAGHDLTAAVKVSANFGNAIVVNPDGVFVAPRSFLSSTVTTANVFAPPDGTNDLTEKVRREGFLGIAQNPASSIDATSFGATGRTAFSGEVVNLGDADHVLRIANGAAAVTVNLPTADATNLDRIYIIANYSSVAGVLSGVNDIDNALKIAMPIPPGSSWTIQQNGGSWCVIDKYLPTAAPIDETVDVTGATLPVVFPIATIPGAPVFAPNQPATANKLYVFPNGQTAVWDGTQYASETSRAQNLVELFKTTAVSYVIPAPVVVTTATSVTTTIETLINVTAPGQTITLPDATLIPVGVEIVVCTSGAWTGLINVNCTGGQAIDGITTYNFSKAPSFGNTGIREDVPKRTFRSTGTGWRQIGGDRTDAYSYTPIGTAFPPSVVIGTPATNPGTIIIDGTEYFEVVDGNYQPAMSLPIITAASKMITIRRGAAFGFSINAENTDLDRPLIFGGGEIARFMPSAGVWRWMDPYPTPAASIKKFYQNVSLIATTGFVLTHNLGLVQPKAYTINAFDSTGQRVELRQTAQTANTITLTSNIALANIDVTVVG